jgi:hypothetical protein
MAYLCGCYYVVIDVHNPYHRPKQYLPLLNSEAHTTILSTISTTTLKQTFTNPSSTNDIKECIYTFPLYDGVSVVGFTCKIGDKTLTGLVKEKVKAKKIFEEAVAKGETAGLLEQAPEASDVFSTKLGNIAAGQSVIVDITYIGELKHHETEGIRFTIPTSIAPRYGSGPAATAHTSPQVDDGIKITVDVHIPEGSFMKGIQSPSHPISVSMGTLSTATQADPVMSKASATLSLGSAALEKDFVLIVQSKDAGVPKALLETHPTIPNHRAIMATLVPKFSLPPSRPEIVFVADRSGSMAGASMEMLVSAMKVFLKSMPAGVKFNICSFGSSTSFLWPQSKAYTSETLEQSMAHVQTFDANMGGTETFNAIRQTVERRFSDLPLEVILLTDGDIWRQNQLFEYVNEQVKSSAGKIRIFPLGIGNGVSHSLIEGLARAGNGFAQAVQSGERLDNSVVRMLRGALSPHITDFTLEVKYEQEDDDFEVIDKVTERMKILLTEPKSKEGKEALKPQETISLFDPSVNPEKEDIVMKDVNVELPSIPTPKLLQAPHKIPSLFAFSRTSVYLLMSPDTIQRNPTSVILRGTSDHGPLALEIPIEVLPEPAETIHQLAVKKAVQDLEEGRGWIVDAKDQAGVLVKDRFPSSFEDLVKREAVRLGETFQVASKWCSFVAVTANDKEIAKSLESDYLKDTDGEFNHEGMRFGIRPTAPTRSAYINLSDDSSEDSEEAVKQARTYAFNSAPTKKRKVKVSGLKRALPPGAGRMSQPVSSGSQPPSATRYAQSSYAALSRPLPDDEQDLPMLQQQNTSRRDMHRSTTGSSDAGRSISFSARSALSSNSRAYYGSAGANAIPPPPPAPALPRNSYIAPGGLITKPLADDALDECENTTAGEPVNHATTWASRSGADRVLALIELQEFDGSWPVGNEEIAAIVGVGMTPAKGDEKAWITLLVVLFLEMKNADEEGTWGMVVEKAREWLGGAVGAGLGELEKAAAEVIGKL